MEFKRQSIIDLHLAGKTKTEIFRKLKKLDVNKLLIHRTIKRYEETGSIATRIGVGGAKRTVTTPEVIEMVRKLIEENPNFSSRQLSIELNISPRSIQRILRNDLGLKAQKIQETKTLTTKQKSRINESTETSSTSSTVKQIHKTDSPPNGLQCDFEPSEDDDSC